MSWHSGAGGAFGLTKIGGTAAKHQRLGQLSERHLNMIFTRLDRNNSNSLGIDDLFVAFRDASMDISKRDIEQMIQLADNNGTYFPITGLGLVASCQTQKETPSFMQEMVCCPGRNGFKWLEPARRNQSAEL